MKTLIYFFIFVLVTNCGYGMARKPSVDEQTRRTVHGASESLSSGRVDLADSILTEGKRIIPAPKQPLVIPPIKDKKGRTIVVLPDKYKGKEVVFKDSDEFISLMKDRAVLKKYQEGERGWHKYSESVEQTIKQEKADKDKIARELEKEKNRNLSIMEMVKILIGAVLGVVFLGVLLVAAKIISAIIGLFKKKDQ